MSECKHTGEFEASTTIKYTDDEHAWFAFISIRCMRCRLQFCWRGVAPGQPNTEEPAVSADGYELRAPIAPQPGGIVGLLRQAGLENMLGPDGPRASNA